MYFPPVKKPRPVLFDLGDTLINFSDTNPLPYMREGTCRAHAFMIGQGIVAPSLDCYFRIFRRSTLVAYAVSEIMRREVDLVGAMRRQHRSLGLPTDKEFLYQLAARFYDPIKALATPEEEIHGVLDWLRNNGHPMGIVSNTMVPGTLLDQHLEEERLLEYFPVRIYSSDVGVKKPDARMFLAALRALNIKPQGTLFIGDRLSLDVKGARRMGMLTALKVRKGPTPRGAGCADFVLRHLKELPALLESLGPIDDDLI